MKTLVASILVLGSVLLAGCGSGEDKALETAAPPPSSSAVKSEDMPNKNRPGAVGAAGGGSTAAPEAAGTSGPL